MDVNELFAKHQGALLRYLTAYSGDPDVAADAAQDVYLRLLNSPPQDETNLQAWLFTAATNVVKDRWRRETLARSSRRSVERAMTPNEPADPQAAAELAERAQVAIQMLARVSEKERTILLMWMEGIAHKDIADAVGTTRGTIGPTIARALKKLSKQIDQFMREDVR